MNDTIELDDLGPVKHVSIPVPHDGGVVVLRGRNDIGKSQTLAAVDALVSGRGTVQKRDGATRGSIRFGEVQLSVAKVPRRSGPELQVTTLDSRLSIADLVNPGLKDADRADVVRIKALIQLSAVTPDIALFYPVLGTKADLEGVIRPETAATTDLVEMAASVKRDLEAASRKAEDLAQNLESQAAGSRQAAEGYDPKANTDLPALQAEFEDLVRNEAALRERKAAAERAEAEYNRARQDLLALEADAASSHRVSVEVNLDTYRKQAAERRAEEAELYRLAESLRAQLADVELRAQQTAALAESAEKIAAECEQQLARTAERDAALAALRERVDAYQPAEPVELAMAQAAVVAGRRAIEVAVQQREKAKHAAAAADADKRARGSRDNAERLRDAAAATEEVLSGVVGGLVTSLAVERGRLMARINGREVPYGELSDGTRWKLAIDIGVEALARRGVPEHRRLLVIAQVAWSELDPVNRLLIRRHAKERRVTILTAEASADEELLAEEFGGD